MTDVIVLGLDGATWDLLDPLMEQGRLPNIRQVVENGYSGTLESTMPPITAPAWLSMATGQNPGKTGVFYFFNRTDPDNLSFEPMGVEDFRDRSFWDVLDAAGHSVGVFNFPMLHPPYRIDGFMISGFGPTPKDRITAPASLQEDLERVTDGYEMKVPYASQQYADAPDVLQRDLTRFVEKHESALEYLLTNRPTDVFFGVVSATDWAQHYFWRYYDTEHVAHEPGHEDALPDLFARVDETVGMVADVAAAEDATLLLVSDHGFGPVNGTVYTNEWLERKGFRVSKSDGRLAKLRTNYFPYVRRVVEPIVARVPGVRELARSIGESVRASPLESLDAEQSVAFAAKQGLTNGLFYFTADDEADRDAVVDALERTCSEHGISVTVYRTDDLYHGPKVDCGPDLMVAFEGFEYAADPRYSTTDDIVVHQPSSLARSGGHRREGIYAIAGPDVQSGSGPTRSLLDIAPTLLALQSVPIPTEMDGEPIADAFGSLDDPDRRPLSTLVDEHSSVEPTNDADIQEQLEDLGYL